MTRSSRNASIEVLDFIEEEDHAALNAEEKVFDEHVNRFSDLVEKLERLEDQGASAGPVRPHASTDHREAASGSYEESVKAQGLESYIVVWIKEKLRSGY